MDIVKFKREQEQHLMHLDRIRKITPVLDTSTPESLGLKHLALRPKKMQLLEDRRQLVAKENSKLMGLMTKIMNEKREQPKHNRPPSLNEVERKKGVDRINLENRLMSERLNRISPVISNSSFEEDFKRHIKAESHLRRRQMKPLALPADLHPNSSLRRNKSNNSFDGFGDTNGLFDASTYSIQKGNYIKGSNLDNLSATNSMSLNSPIKSVSEFRKQVISTKKINRNHQEIMNQDLLGIGESRMSLDTFQGRRTFAPSTSIDTSVIHHNLPPPRSQTAKNDSLFEMSYRPSQTS